ncbi:hypothetical protein BC629DRAFT_1434124 [Irpex lacteus]|nr:hypothetical protein BC629DRAFT_1434124 [Irpex lacteus]
MYWIAIKCNERRARKRTGEELKGKENDERSKRHHIGIKTYRRKKCEIEKRKQHNNLIEICIVLLLLKKKRTKPREYSRTVSIPDKARSPYHEETVTGPAERHDHNSRRRAAGVELLSDVGREREVIDKKICGVGDHAPDVPSIFKATRSRIWKVESVDEDEIDEEETRRRQAKEKRREHVYVSHATKHTALSPIRQQNGRLGLSLALPAFLHPLPACLRRPTLSGYPTVVLRLERVDKLSLSYLERLLEQALTRRSNSNIQIASLTACHVAKRFQLGTYLASESLPRANGASTTQKTTRKPAPLVHIPALKETEKKEDSKKEVVRHNVRNVFYSLTHGFFVSPNANYLPDIPPLKEDMRSIFEGLHPRFAFDNYFYLALVPQRVRYDIPMFQCLAPLSCRLERVSTSGVEGYRLNEKLCAQWEALERVTIRIQRKLLRRTAGTYLDTCGTPYPSTLGYSSVWNTREQALRAVRLGRTAFTLRFAFLSYLIMCELNKERRTWDELVSDPEDPVPLAICNSFAASWICDFTVPRVGAFVEICCQQHPFAGRAWFQDIPCFLAFHVPIWFAYGNNPHPSVHISKIAEEYRLNYLPNDLSVYVLRKATTDGHDTDNSISIANQYAAGYDTPAVMDKNDYYGYYRQEKKPSSRAFVMRRVCKTTVYEVDVREHTAYVSLIDEHYPTHAYLENRAPELNYRQSRDDTYDTFIAREKKINAALASTESTAQREERLARETKNASQPVPDKYGPTVFAWIGERPHVYRQLVKLEDIPALWERTSLENRTFNAFRNEYDVDDRLFYEYQRRNESELVHNNEDTARLGAEIMPKIPMKVDVGPADMILREGSVIPDTEAIRSVIIQRFGYRSPLTSWKSVTREGKEWVEGNKVTKMYRTLGNWERGDNFADDTLRPEEFVPLADFIVQVKDGQTPSYELSDLSPWSGRLQCPPRYNALKVRQLTSYRRSFDGKQTGEQWYLLLAIGEDKLETVNGCRILTDMATNVLHLQRGRFGETEDAIFHSLVRRGIRVRLLRPVHSTFKLAESREWTRTVGNKPLGIGIKPNGVELSIQDYKVYIRMRDELLNGPAGRAALLRGGIVWRLAWGKCSVEETSEGPDVENEAAHARIAIERIGAETYAEATLSLQDMYIIVGVHRISNHKTAGPASHASITSWWPTDETWSTSGYGTGYWTHAAEVWFQRRLRMLKEGKAKAMTQNEWRKSLRHTLSDSDKFLQCIERLSSRRVSQRM